MEYFGKNHNILVKILSHLELSEIHNSCIVNKNLKEKICRDKFYRDWLRYSNPNIQIPTYDISNWIKNYRNLYFKTSNQTFQIFRGVLAGSVVESWPDVYFVSLDYISYKFNLTTHSLEKLRDNVKYQSHNSYLTLKNELYFKHYSSTEYKLLAYRVSKVFTSKETSFYLMENGEFYRNHDNCSKFKRMMPNVCEMFIDFKHKVLYYKTKKNIWYTKSFQYISEQKRYEFGIEFDKYALIKNKFYILSKNKLYKILQFRSSVFMRAKEIPTNVQIQSLKPGFITSTSNEIYKIIKVKSNYYELEKQTCYSKITKEIHQIKKEKSELIIEY